MLANDNILMGNAQVLMKDGADELRRIVAAARPFPISGLIRCPPCVYYPDPCRPSCFLEYVMRGQCRVEDMSQEVLHDLGAAPAPKGGIASGIPALDRLYRVRISCCVSFSQLHMPNMTSGVSGQVDVGQVTVIAGLPGSGLSQLTDALLLRLARQHGAAFAIASLRCRVRAGLRNVGPPFRQI